jgi:peptidoglycan/LPS O-acetylase OafA/YrhL
MAKSVSPSRFYSLDVLRGVAALSVVFCYWQHFFLPFNKQGVSFSIENQPMFQVLYVFYEKGYEAVQLFFCLSGFIFFWLYSKRISEDSISPGTFAVLRLSRLYPLHFATLLYVCACQFVYTMTTNTYFVYPINDTYHFLLNVFFVSAWGFEKGFSFNSPVWSVSVEVLLYAMFFVFCRAFNRNLIALLLAIFVAHLFHGLNDAIAGGVKNFFVGGFVFIAYEKLINTGDRGKVSLWLPFVAFIAWLATIAVMNPNYNFGFDRLPMIAQKMVSAWPSLVLFPMTVMCLALIETKRGTFGKRLSFIGDISYSVYLLHFPLQLTIAMAAAALAVNGTLYYSQLIMALFFSALIMLSLVSHRYFEGPMQRFLRSKVLVRQATASIQEVA